MADEANDETTKRRKRKGPSKREREQAETIDKRDKSLKRSRKRNRELADDLDRARGNRVVNHAAHGVAAIAGTVIGEFIGDAEFAKDTLDTPIKARAIPAALGGLVAVLGGDLLGEGLADAIGMGLMAPAQVALGEMLYDKLTEEDAPETPAQTAP